MECTADRRQHILEGHEKCTPPAEVHRNIGMSEFIDEYDRFRTWMNEIEDAPYGHEFVLVHALIVKQLKTQNVFEVKLSDIHGASLWQPRWVPASGTIISVKQHGACSVLSVRKSPDMTRFYSYCMSTPFARDSMSSHMAHGFGMSFTRACVCCIRVIGGSCGVFSANSEAAQLEPENEHQEVGVGHPIEIHRTARHGWRRRNIEHGVEHTFFMQGPEWLACLCQKQQNISL